MEQVSYDDATVVEPTAEVVAVPRQAVLAQAARSERGMVSAEWAVGIIAAVAIAGVLLAVVTTGQVRSALLDVIITVIGTFARFVNG